MYVWCMYVNTCVCMCVCVCVCVCVCMYVCMYVYIYIYIYIYIVKQIGFKQKLQITTKHTKHSKESRSTRLVQVLKVFKRQEPQQLLYLYTFSVPNRFSFTLTITPTSVSIPFIIFPVWIFTVCYKHKKIYFSLQQKINLQYVI